MKKNPPRITREDQPSGFNPPRSFTGIPLGLFFTPIPIRSTVFVLSNYVVSLNQKPSEFTIYFLCYVYLHYIVLSDLQKLFPTQDRLCNTSRTTATCWVFMLVDPFEFYRNLPDLVQIFGEEKSTESEDIFPRIMSRSLKFTFRTRRLLLQLRYFFLVVFRAFIVMTDWLNTDVQDNFNFFLIHNFMFSGCSRRGNWWNWWLFGRIWWR